tara:strand:- start:796 stop:1197 length:402 start_codon:yes stop_codon:yes gene_type:complete
MGFWIFGKKNGYEGLKSSLESLHNSMMEGQNKIFRYESLSKRHYNLIVNVVPNGLKAIADQIKLLKEGKEDFTAQNIKDIKNKFEREVTLFNAFFRGKVIGVPDSRRRREPIKSIEIKYNPKSCDLVIIRLEK